MATFLQGLSHEQINTHQRKVGRDNSEQGEFGHRFFWKNAKLQVSTLPTIGLATNLSM